MNLIPPNLNLNFFDVLSQTFKLGHFVKYTFSLEYTTSMIHNLKCGLVTPRHTSITFRQSISES